MTDKFTLDGHKAVPCEDLMDWAKWYEDADRHIADTVIGDIRVSTVFLGINHEWDPGKPPLLFETMMFGGEYDEDMWRYSTWEEAEAGHEKAVGLLKKPSN